MINNKAKIILENIIRVRGKCEWNLITCYKCPLSKKFKKDNCEPSFYTRDIKGSFRPAFYSNDSELCELRFSNAANKYRKKFGNTKLMELLL